VQKRKEAVTTGTASLETRPDWTEHALIGLLGCQHLHQHELYQSLNIKIPWPRNWV